MAAVINTNVPSLTAQRNLNMSQASLSTSLQRLSSGLRINNAKDDAAGLAISERMSSQIRGLDQARRNANDGISLSQTGEGSLVEIGNNLQRIRELAVQSANDTNSASDRRALQSEVTQRIAEITRVASTTEFNGKKLLDGTFTAQQFQVGANANQTISFSMNDARSSAIGNNTTNGGGTLNVAVAAAAGAGARVANSVAAQTLTVSGGTGFASTTVAVGAGATAKAISDGVNSVTSTTGVTAQAKTEAVLGGFSAADTFSFTLFGQNSTGVAISANISNVSDLTSLSDAINAKAGTTGITATLATNKSSITLKNDAGEDISITDLVSATAGKTATLQGRDAFAGTNAGAAATLGAAVGTDSSTVAGTVKYSSESNFTLQTSAGTTVLSGASVASSLSQVSAVDIGTVTGANNALDVVDAALQQINSQRAALGAVQNRFESTITNLQTTSENLSASRSRIRDADFAAETANLSRNQVLQQAGTAMLAQANALPNQVLSLLRG